MLQHNRTVAALRRRSKSDGFTLVELLVVIVILGILAGVVVFAVANISERSKTNACKSEKRTVRTAMEAYKANHATGAAASNTNDLITANFLDKAPEYWNLSGGVLSRTGDATNCT